MSRIMSQIQREVRRIRYKRSFRRFRTYTMIGRETYVANLELACRYGQGTGAVVECGTWRGGMIAGMAENLGSRREYCLFDSFEGLPNAGEIDGVEARKWQSDKESPTYHDNCRAGIEAASAAMTLAGVGDARIIKGWFAETLPSVELRDGIRVLRVDADWYNSTMDVLSNLFPRVNLGGLIILDDYYTWEGCSKAVHQYLSMNNRPERLLQRGGFAYMLKC